MSPTDRQLALWLDTLKHIQECLRDGLEAAAILELRFLECLVWIEVESREIERREEPPRVGAEQVH